MDKSKESKLDDLGLESDDDKDLTAGATTDVDESAKHFSSVSVAEMMEFGSLSTHPTASQLSHLPRDSSQKVDTVAASASWHAAKAVCSDLTNIPPASGHDEDSDKEHNIGTYRAFGPSCIIFSVLSVVWKTFKIFRDTFLVQTVMFNLHFYISILNKKGISIN